jgi:S-adenosylmethionine:tRNA ribosyltransferase-isomerase
LRISDFDYDLPEELIAQEPLADRAGSRMLVIDRATGRWEDRWFRELPAYLGAGDCLVLNNSKVFPSRLYGHREGFEGKVEVFLTRPISEDRKTWLALVRPGRKIRSGDLVQFGEQMKAKIIGRGEFGERTLHFDCEGDIYEKLDAIGHVPLPPYIARPDRPEDRERYQTVFARTAGSVAAPTAGLHFTEEMLDACRKAGAEIAQITLHVGLGTFQPLHTDVIEDVKLHSEHYEIDATAAAAMQRASRRIAVGTTSVRTIETAALEGTSGETNLFIHPGFHFRATNAMLTNFHLPKSSLLVLVCAFAGRELTLAAYRHAVEQRYRFFSYGDCMLIV